jgi:hypothetical protein
MGPAPEHFTELIERAPVAAQLFAAIMSAAEQSGGAGINFC